MAVAIISWMINFHENYVAKLGLEVSTTGSAVRGAVNCATEPFFFLCWVSWPLEISSRGGGQVSFSGKPLKEIIRPSTSRTWLFHVV